MNKLLYFFYTMILGKIGDSDNECIFCLELLNNFKTSDIDDIITTNIKLNCNHLFHLDCFFLYVKYNSEKLDDLECPLCRKKILKNDIRKILILYFFLLKKLSLKISIRNLFNFLKVLKRCLTFNIIRQGYTKTASDDESDRSDESDEREDLEFLKAKICFRLKQIRKIIFII